MIEENWSTRKCKGSKSLLQEKKRYKGSLVLNGIKGVVTSGQNTPRSAFNILKERKENVRKKGTVSYRLMPM